MKNAQNTLNVFLLQHLLQVGVGLRESAELAEVDAAVFVRVHTHHN
jgi:hypothetical protein